MSWRFPRSGARVGVQAVRRDPLAYARDVVFHRFNLAMAPADAQTVGRVLFGWDRAIDTPLMTAIRERVWTALAFQGVVRLAGLMAFLVLPLAMCLQTWRQGLWRLADGCYLATALYFIVLTSLLISTYGRFLLPGVAHFLSKTSRDAF